MLRKLIGIIFLTTMLYSCGESIGDIEYTASADAFIRAIKKDSKVVYAPVFFGKGTTKTSMGIATALSGKKYNLKNFWNYENEVRWIPTSTDYSETFPETETYEIKITSDKKEEKTITQTVALKDVPESFDILKLDIDKTSKTIVVGWTKSKADFYTMTISEDMDSFPIFQSTRYTSKEATVENPQITITSTSLKWFADLFDGKTYTIQVHAYNKSGTTNNGEVDIVGEFIATKTFTW